MRIVIKDAVTPNMLKEIQDFIETQESSDKETETSTIHFAGDYGLYIIKVVADEDAVESITINCVDTEHNTDANKLKRYMLETGLSQVDLAYILEISKQALNQFLMGQRPVPENIWKKLKNV